MVILLIGSIGKTLSSGWQFIRSSVETGIEQLSSIAGVISEKIGISYEDVRWGQGLADDAVQTWNKLNELPDFYKVSDKFALKTSFDYRENYIMNMKVHAYDRNTNEIVEQWITVESNNPLTKQEWFELAREAVTDTPLGTDLVLEYATEFEYYVKL